jgi:hypothetical protein
MAGIFGPSNYDECVLAAMKGVTSDVAARAIVRSCREKFPARVPASVALPSAALAAIDGRAQLDIHGTDLFGDIYNGNSKWTITSLSVRVTPALNGKPVVGARSREYVIPVSIAPLSNKSFNHRIGSGDWRSEIQWTIVAAQGYEN